MTIRHIVWSVPGSRESNSLNNFAISSGGIGDALQRSAAALKAANNNLDESIALVTAANTVVKCVPLYAVTCRTKMTQNGETPIGRTIPWVRLAIN